MDHSWGGPENHAKCFKNVNFYLKKERVALYASVYLLYIICLPYCAVDWIHSVFIYCLKRSSFPYRLVENRRGRSKNKIASR